MKYRRKLIVDENRRQIEEKIERRQTTRRGKAKVNEIRVASVVAMNVTPSVPAHSRRVSRCQRCLQKANSERAAGARACQPASGAFRATSVRKWGEMKRNRASTKIDESRMSTKIEEK